MIDYPKLLNATIRAADRLPDCPHAQRSGIRARSWLRAWETMAPGHIDDVPSDFIRLDYVPVGKWDAPLVSFLRERGEAAVPEICENLGCSNGGIRYVLRYMCTHGILEWRIGGALANYGQKLYKLAAPSPALAQIEATDGPRGLSRRQLSQPGKYDSGVLEYLREHGTGTVTDLVHGVNGTYCGVAKAIKRLQKQDLISETTLRSFSTAGFPKFTYKLRDPLAARLASETDIDLR